MTDRALCLDTSVLVKVIREESGSAEARSLIRDAIAREASLVAPAFAWTEVGSVLRKHVRARLLASREADGLWALFLGMPVDYIDGQDVRTRAWRIAAEHRLATLYDAAFLACAELLRAADVDAELWTADRKLIAQLGPRRPAYVRELGR